MSTKAPNPSMNLEPAPPLESLELTWDTDDDVRQSLGRLFKHVETMAEEAVGWYYRQKTWKRRFSVWTRFAAVVATGLGGILPLADDALTPFVPTGLDLKAFGYLSLALAATLLALDGFFGFSHSWMRYIRAAFEIEKILEDYRLRWAEREAHQRGRAFEGEDISKAFELLKEFSGKVKGAVGDETRQWIERFSTKLTEMDKRAMGEVNQRTGRLGQS